MMIHLPSKRKVKLLNFSTKRIKKLTLRKTLKRKKNMTNFTLKGSDIKPKELLDGMKLLETSRWSSGRAVLLTGIPFLFISLG